MTIRELIESKAREAATGFYPSDIQDLEGLIRTTLIAILTDPAVGFKEALELAHRNRFLCQNCRRSIWDRKCDDHCTCPCHTAEAKLKELKELSK